MQHVKHMRLRDYAVLIFLAFLLFSIYRTSTEVAPSTQPTLTIHGVTLSVEVARTPAQQQRGLSGRDMLAEGSGMLFLFDRPERYGFWMPNMHFAIDIIWIGSDWRIVDIAENVTPESYPTLFKPNAPAQYVLEVPAGAASRYGWKDGDEVEFERL